MHSPILLHATTVAIDGVAAVIEGPSGAGKSDLALRLVDGGARLVADDRTAIALVDGRLVARPPDTIAGLMEVRGIGIVEMPHVAEATVGLIVVLVPAHEIERMPDSEFRALLGFDVPVLRLDPHPASAAAKVRLAVARAARR
ncbi:MAG: HPr kinase/phosphorylase [Alphaproteobacteria bacterium]